MSTAQSKSSIIRVDHAYSQSDSVGRFRASRDIPLPYESVSESSLTGASSDQPSARSSTENRDSLTPMISKTGGGGSTGIDLESGPAAASPTALQPHGSPGDSLRRRKTDALGHGRAGPSMTPSLRAVGSILHMAHAQDYAKRKRPDDQQEDIAGASSDEEDAEENMRSTEDLEDEREIEDGEALLRRTTTESKRRDTKGTPRGGESSGHGSGPARS